MCWCVGFLHVKETPSAAHPVLPVPSVQSAASVGCGSCFPTGSAVLPLLRGPTVRGRCHLRCPALPEWEGCSGTRSPCDRTPHPCRSLAPDGTRQVWWHQKDQMNEFYRVLWITGSNIQHSPIIVSVFFFRHLFSSLEEDQEHLPLTCIQKNSLLDPALNFST